MTTAKMSTTVFDNVLGSEILATLSKKIKADPNKKYSIIIRPQRTQAQKKTQKAQTQQTLREVVDEMRKQAKENGLTPEILADILEVDVKEIS